MMRTSTWKAWGPFMALILLGAAFGALLFATTSADASGGRPVENVRGTVVRPGVALWVHVHPAPKGGGSNECDDTGTNSDFALFANAKSDGLTFNINTGQIPANLAPATAVGAITDSFAAWDAASPGYFTVNTSGGASGPSQDGNNTVGWLNIVPPRTLAATWTWTDTATNRVLESDIFFNNRHAWGVFGGCNDEDAFEVGNVGTHEVGHTIALDHVSNSYSTMAATASSGEVRKQTLTQGDADGFLASLAGTPPPPPDDGGGGGPPPCKGKNKNDPGC